MLQLLTGAAAYMGGNIAVSFFNKVKDPFLLTAGYRANEQAKSQLPSFDMAYSAMLRGYMPKGLFHAMTAYNNINTSDDDGHGVGKQGRDAWIACLAAMTPHFQAESLFNMLFRGEQSIDFVKERLNRTGWNADNLAAIQKNAYGIYTIDQIFYMFLRGIITEKKAIEYLRRTSVMNESHVKDLFELRKFIAPPSDLIRFAVRDVWNDQIVKDFGLDAEYDQNGDMRLWMQSQGIGDVTIKGPDGKEYKTDMAKLYWMAHWQTMSPTQGYLAKHRLRPDRLGKWGEGIAGLEAFEQKQLEDLLKRSDYTPKERKWLSAINQRVLQFRQARQLYDEEVIDKKELYETMLDFGYVKQDANNLTKLYEQLKKDKEDKEKEKEDNKKYGKLRAAILKGYEEGSINEAIAFNSLVNTGMDSEEAAILLRAIDIHVNRRLVKQYVAMVKSEFFLGGMDPAEAVAGLVSGGLSTERAHQYVILWQRQLSRPRRVTQANKLLDWYKHGYLSDLDLSRRLSLLGYGNGDILIYNAEANRLLDENLARIEAARARTERQQIEASERIQRQAQSALSRAISHMRTYSSITKMEQWYKAGLIDAGTVITRMQFMQVPQVDIDRYLTEWNLEMGGNNG